MNIDIKKRCICDSNKVFSECCEPLIINNKKASSALELMRSRYSAYVLKKGQYLYDTCSETLKNVEDIHSINNQEIDWLGLRVVSFSDLEVTFIAYYKEDSHIKVLKEQSFFVIEDERLRYDFGIMLEATIGKNEICPCGSGKKFKKCCS